MNVPPFELDAAEVQARRKAWLRDAAAVLDARQWWWRRADTWHGSALVAAQPDLEEPLRDAAAMRRWLQAGLAEAAWPAGQAPPGEADAVAVRGFVYSPRLKADLVVTLASDDQLAVTLLGANGKATPQTCSLDAPRLQPAWADAMLRTAALLLELDPQGPRAAEALDLARTAYEADPSEHRGAMAYAELLLRAGNVSEALHVWQTLHAAHPYLPAPLIRLSDTLIRLAVESEDQQLLAMADAATGQAAYRFPEQADANVVRARFLYAISKPEEARATLHRVLEHHTAGIAEAHHLLGMIAYDEANYPEALTHLEQSLAERDHDADVHRLKAQTHHALGELENARTHLEAAEHQAAGDPRLIELRTHWFGN